METKIMRVVQQGEAFAVQSQKSESGQTTKCNIVLQEMGGKYENQYAAAMLGNALRTECRYLISHSLLVGRKEKTLALIIESHTTQLHVLAAIILLELIATIVFLVAPFSIIFLHV